MDLISFDNFITMGVQLIGAALIMLIGVASRPFVEKLAQRPFHKAPQEIRLLVARLVYFVVIVVFVLLALDILGLHIAAIITLLGAAGFALSLSLQTIAANIFAGVYILIERPFRVGDEIRVQDFRGIVEDIDLRITVIRTSDNEHVMVPNSVVMSEIVVKRITTHEPTSQMQLFGHLRQKDHQEVAKADEKPVDQ